MGRFPQTFYEAEASNRFTFRLEISALPRYPDRKPNFALTKKPVRERRTGPWTING